jgi:hypothetical protein
MHNARADLALSSGGNTTLSSAVGLAAPAQQFHSRKEDPGAAAAAWLSVARTALLSRTLDLIEETELLPKGKLRHQFSARGHELVQAVLAAHLRHPHDAAMGYYRSRPFLLGAGLTAREAFAGSLGLATGRTRGRDVGVVLNLRPRHGATVLPTSGTWERSTRRWPAGPRRSSTAPPCCARPRGRTRSRSRWAAMPRWRPAASGPR